MSEARNDARKAFADSGLSYAHLSRYDLEILRNILGKHLKNSGLIKEYKMDRSVRVVNWPKGWAALTCSSYYFEKREAITFNDNGFIGFAGWSDDENVAPILNGFVEWISETIKVKTVGRAALERSEG